MDFRRYHCLGAWAQKEEWFLLGIDRVPILYRTCRLHQITGCWISILSMDSRILVVLGRYILGKPFFNLFVVVSALYSGYNHDRESNDIVFTTRMYLLAPSKTHLLDSRHAYFIAVAHRCIFITFCKPPARVYI